MFAIMTPFSGSIPIFLLFLVASCAMSSVVYVQHYKKHQLCRKRPGHLGHKMAWRVSFSVVITWFTFTCLYFVAWMMSVWLQTWWSPVQLAIEAFIDTTIKANLSSVIVEADDFSERLGAEGQQRLSGRRVDRFLCACSVNHCAAFISHT